MLAKNCRISAGKNSKHIKTKFFLITDKFSMGDIKIQHRGTDEMWADMNTNTTQGKSFRFMCCHVMGISEDYDDNLEHRRTNHLFSQR